MIQILQGDWVERLQTVPEECHARATTRMNADPLDTRKQAIESAMLSNAEDKAQVAALGKAAYDGYSEESKRQGWNPTPWSDLLEKDQCRWVTVAQAVLDEARRCGWI